jgi:hypothetical protein
MPVVRRVSTKFKQVTQAFDNGYAHGSICSLQVRLHAPKSLSVTEAKEWLEGAFKAFKDRTV